MATVEAKQILEYEIVHFQTKQFDISNKAEYYKKFEDHILSEIIKKGTNFSDSYWIYKYKSEDRKINFPNELLYKKLEKIFDKKRDIIEVACKSFVLYNLYSSFIVKFTSLLKKLSDGTFNKSTSGEITLMRSFIEYLKVPIEVAESLEEILEEVEEYETYSNGVGRVLPEFIDIYLFKDIIDDIVFNKGLENYKEYLMTIMWWKITSILPMRPTEFLRIPYDCIIDKKDSSDGKYKLRVKRTLLKSKKYIANWHCIEGAYREETVSIDEWVYNLIVIYKNILNCDIGYIKNKELFPIEVYKISFFRNAERELNSDIAVFKDLNRNINQFYSQVVQKQYGYIPISKMAEKNMAYGEKCIKKITPHDARHISIINLIYLGIDVYKVMQLAGHEYVNTTLGYYEQMDEFARGSVFAFNKTNNMIISRKDDNEFLDNDFKEVHKNIIKERLQLAKGKKTNSVKVKGGYCTYVNVRTDRSKCDLYEVNHSICPYFRPSNNSIIQAELEKTEKVYRAEVKVLMDIVRDANTIHRSNQLISVGIVKLQNLVNDMRVQNQRLYHE